MGKILAITAERTTIVLINALINLTQTKHTIEIIHTSYEAQILSHYNQNDQVDIIFLDYPFDGPECIRQARANHHTHDAFIVIATCSQDDYIDYRNDRRIAFTDTVRLFSTL